MESSTELHIRSMQPQDLDVILSIEVDVHQSPWTKGIFDDCLRVGYICSVLEQGKQIHSYGVVSVVADEMHILNICVAKVSQRQGYGSTLIRHFMALAQQGQVNTIFLEVRPSNVAALAMYDGFGFNQAGIREDYYPTQFGGREDAYILAKAL